MAEAPAVSATPEKTTPKKGGRKPRSGKREKKSIPHATATVQASFNNTIIAIADQEEHPCCGRRPGRVQGLAQ